MGIRDRVWRKRHSGMMDAEKQGLGHDGCGDEGLGGGSEQDDSE